MIFDCPKRTSYASFDASARSVSEHEVTSAKPQIIQRTLCTNDDKEACFRTAKRLKRKNFAKLFFANRISQTFIERSGKNPNFVVIIRFYLEKINTFWRKRMRFPFSLKRINFSKQFDSPSFTRIERLLLG